MVVAYSKKIAFYRFDEAGSIASAARSDQASSKADIEAIQRA
jgi:hypothetical protein